MADERSPVRQKPRDPFFRHALCVYFVIALGVFLWVGGTMASAATGNFGLVVIGLGLLGHMDVRILRLKSRIEELEKQIQGSAADRELNG